MTSLISLARFFTSSSNSKNWKNSVRNLVSFPDLDAGSENGDNPEGNGTFADVSAVLVPQEHRLLRH